MNKRQMIFPFVKIRNKFSALKETLINIDGKINQGFTFR